MNLAIKLTGPAGKGINSTAHIIMSIFSKLGYYIISDTEYQSLIKGGLNWFDIFVSDNKENAISKKVDIVISFDDKNLENVLKSLNKGGYIIINKKYSEKLKKNLNFSEYKLLELDIKDKYDNTYLLGILSKLLSLDESLVLSKIEEVFYSKGDLVLKYNKAIISNIYKSYILSSDFDIKSIGKPKKIIYGNKALALGAISSCLEYYSGYPMTPSSSLLSEIINSKKVTFLQAEDEISVINSALGASFTGKRSMVGTSGGGFALMTEALSFSVQAEIPIVVVLSQRAGPSTGTPTFHESADLNFALNPTFGDFQHIVIQPSSLEEAYYYGGYSLNLADKYQSIVILLMDKQSSDMYSVVDNLKSANVDRGNILDKAPENYKRYELTKDGISPRVKVGTKYGDFIATSYEHDEYGATTEDTKIKQKMTEKRFRKLNNFFKTQEEKGYEIINPEARKKFILTGFNSYVTKEFVRKNPEFGIIIIKVLKPLNKEILDQIKKLDELIFIENNYSGQLENYI
ncbi:hypothetical protein CSA08_01090, partial [Candidatus Gracilibacteria bacterium]